MQLISHADDFGIRTSVNNAIIEGVEKGRITEISTLVTYPAVSETLTFHKKYPKVLMGIHINLSNGFPLSSAKDIPTLVQADGSFYSLPSLLRRLALKQVNPDHLRKEMDAQIQKFKELYGFSPLHADTHHNSHFTPLSGKIIVEEATKHGIKSIRAGKKYLNRSHSLTPMVLNFLMSQSHHPRIANQEIIDLFVDPRFLGNKSLAETLRSLPENGKYELMWHLSDKPDEEWLYKQFTLLLEDEWWDVIKEKSIKLTTY